MRSVINKKTPENNNGWPAEEVEKVLGVVFKNKATLQTAFTHRSYLNEHPNYRNPSNERMEFLGDAVLQFLTSKYLYENFPKSPEGQLTNFRAATVNTESLAAEAQRLSYGAFLLLSKGEEDSGGRERNYILANTFEAVLGGLYLEKGITCCQKFLEKNLFYKIKEIIQNEAYRDYKSSFQELAQEKKGITPVYEVLEDWGPDHDKNFRMGVFLGKVKYGEGAGKSKQKAEQAAAKNALEGWKKMSIL